MKAVKRAARTDLREFPKAEVERRSRSDAAAAPDGLQRSSLKRRSPVECEAGAAKMVKVPSESVEATRAALEKGWRRARRKRKITEDDGANAAASSSSDLDANSDEESPNKIRKLSESGDGLCSDEGEGMEVQDGSEDYGEDAHKEVSFCAANDGEGKEAFGKHRAADKCQSRTAVKLDDLELGKNLRSRWNYNEVQGRKESSQRPAPYASGNIVRPQKNYAEALIPRSSIKSYRNVPAERISDTVMFSKVYPPKSNFIPPSAVSISSRHQKSNIPVRKSSVSRVEKGGLSKHLWFRLLLASVGLLCLLVYWFRLDSYLHLGAGVLHSENSTSIKFDDQLMVLKSRFPSQREELWSRSRMYLRKHLHAHEPVEPASMILTSGRRAEKSLRCLAVRMAHALSATVNATFLQIDGAGKASLDSDAVKLDIDERLRRAFEGNKGAAVIHRFEELPPGSTLIFYKYCDHEHAAFKNTFLIFTVVLPVEELEGRLHLNEVEELVRDHVQDRFLSQSRSSAFDEMDVDKFGGLWSRIAHLVLPVALEEDVQQAECRI